MPAVVVSEDLAKVFSPETCAELHLQPGKSYAVIPRGEGVLLVPVPSLEDLRGILPGADRESYRERQP